MPERESIAQSQYNLCLKLVSLLETNTQLPKILNELAKNIEQSYEVEKCVILRTSGKEMVEGREYRIPYDEVFMDDLREEMRPILVNDVTKDKTLAKELHKYFKLKVYNLMFLPNQELERTSCQRWT